MKATILAAATALLIAPMLPTAALADHICGEDEGGYVYCPDSPPPPPPPAPAPRHTGPAPTICFFTEPAFAGKSLCLTGSGADFHLDAPWRNAIKSIRIESAAQIRVCPKNLLQGSCTTFSSSVRRLQDDLYNRVHSFRIFGNS